MSSQRYLLIALGILLVCSVQAQNGLSLKTNVSFLSTDSGNGYSALNRLTWDRPLARNLALQVRSDLNSTSPIIPTNIQKLWHNGLAELNYKTDKLQLSADYRNIIFGGAEIMNIFPAWDLDGSKQHLMQHQGTVNAAYDASFLQAEAYAQAKYLRYKQYTLDPDTWELVPGDNAGVTDIYYGAALQVPIIDGLKAQLDADHKDGIFAAADQYTLTTVTGGLSAEYDVFNQGTIAASFNWTDRLESPLDDEHRNFLQTRIRYRHKLTEDLAGYILYINNSCINGSLDELYLVSNYVRGQLQLTLPEDASGGSYILLGGKFSPENESSAWFAELNYRLVGNLYTGILLNEQIDRLTTMQGRLSYFISPVNELQLQYTHRQNKIQHNTSDYIGIGSNLYW